MGESTFSTQVRRKLVYDDMSHGSWYRGIGDGTLVGGVNSFDTGQGEVRV